MARARAWKVFVLLALCWGVVAAAFAAIDPPGRLAPGEFEWFPEAAPAGPLLLVVSLDEQQAHLYRNGVRIAVTTVSTGKPGNETPEGVYTILQKHEEHYSNLYDNAPMPYMQRLTWSGIALHAGRLPGYPASHGCIRLPEEFARRLFGLTSLGMTVVVAGRRTGVPQLARPGWLAPPVPGQPAATSAARGDFWRPELAPDGPMTVLVGTSERTIRVLRNGVEIGRSAIRFDGPPPVGLRVFQLQAGTRAGESAHVPGRPRLNWVRVVADGGQADPDADSLGSRLHVPPEFARQVYDALRPGTTVVVTDAALETTMEIEPLLETAPAD